MNQKFFIPTDVYSQNCFDAEGNLIKSATFKYVLVRDTKENSRWQLILLEPKKDHLHAKALFLHMESNNLTEIEVHGGGYIALESSMQTVRIVGTSFGFKSVDPLEFILAVKEYFPDCEVDYEDVLELIEEEKKTHHKIYSLEEVILITMK